MFTGGLFTAGAWKPIQATAGHISRMAAIRDRALEQCADCAAVVLPEVTNPHAGPVKVSTGLGLPLCRGFASTAGGWLALQDDPLDVHTTFWCVLEASRKQDDRKASGFLTPRSRWMLVKSLRADTIDAAIAVGGQRKSSAGPGVVADQCEDVPVLQPVAARRQSLQQCVAHS